jgi:hypothetical protein
MAQRVATEYVNASLTVTEAEMPRLISLCEIQQLKLQVFVMDNGNQEIVMEDEAGGEAIRLTFERCGGEFACKLSCRVVKPKLNNALRKLVAHFKGDAVVRRIYPGFAMIYHYERGQVARIQESRGGEFFNVYERRDTAGRLEAQFRLQSVEEEIGYLRSAVNALLDLRNRVERAEAVQWIDKRLEQHSRRLFALEA